MTLEPTTDILKELGSRRAAGQVLVGFAAEHGPGGVERARAKLERKSLDMIVMNDVSRTDIGFDSSQNELVLVTAHDERTVTQALQARLRRRALGRRRRPTATAPAPAGA